MLIFIVVFVLLIFGFTWFLVIGIVMSQQRAKKQARQMLERGEVGEKTIKKVLSRLSQTKDNEGKRLYSQLSDLAER